MSGQTVYVIGQELIRMERRGALVRAKRFWERVRKSAGFLAVPLLCSGTHSGGWVLSLKPESVPPCGCQQRLDNMHSYGEHTSIIDRGIAIGVHIEF